MRTNDIPPWKKKTAVSETITKISVQPDRPLTAAQRMFDIYDGKLDKNK